MEYTLNESSQEYKLSERARRFHRMSEKRMREVEERNRCWTVELLEAAEEKLRNGVYDRSAEP